jgi:hypothetical protein
VEISPIAVDATPIPRLQFLGKYSWNTEIESLKKTNYLANTRISKIYS